MKTYHDRLKELETYTGMGEKPADFTDYWKDALEELDRINPDVSLQKAEFQGTHTECFHLYFTGVNGSRIHAQYLRPKNISHPIPALLQFHGYRWNAGDWCEKMAYTDMGFAIASMDCRGQGGLSEDLGSVRGTTVTGHVIRGITDTKEKLLYRQIFLDTTLLPRILMRFEEIDAEKLGVFGTSQGGGLAIACAALTPEIKKAAPCSPFLSDYQGACCHQECQGAYLELWDYFRILDPCHEQEQDFFRQLQYIDIRNLAPWVKADVLWGIGLEDKACPPSTQFAAYNALTSDKKMIIYPEYGHEPFPGFQDKMMQFMTELL